jgi:hypothetical protein
MLFKSLRTIAFASLAIFGGMLGSALFQPEAPRASTVNPEQRLVATFGVGGVVTAEGELWQYRPDKDRWLKLDESFALEGQASQIVPLPLPPAEIRIFETFGFFIDQDDKCWLYDIEEKHWAEIGSPPGN